MGPKQFLLYGSVTIATKSLLRQLAAYPVLDPVVVPPFHWIDLHAVHLHAEVQMIAAGEPGRPAAAQALALLHHVSRLYADRAHVAVDRLQPVAVIEHDAIPVDSQVVGIHHLPVIGGRYRHMLRDR